MKNAPTSLPTCVSVRTAPSRFRRLKLLPQRVRKQLLPLKVLLLQRKQLLPRTLLPLAKVKPLLLPLRLPRRPLPKVRHLQPKRRPLLPRKSQRR